MGTRNKIITSLTAVAISTALGTVAAPANAAPHIKPALGNHQYNPHAPLGSFDNPIIAGGSQNLAVLTAAQRAALDKMKVALEAKAKKGAVKPSPRMRPNTTNCQYDAYWSECDTTSFGWIDLATTLDSNYHEMAAQEGNSSDFFDTYMDQSTDGGFKWSGFHSEVVNADFWGVSINDGPGYYDRGCIYDQTKGLVFCDAWH